ncbi:hypothetical protein CEXT_77141, partial [Caerostris extrusa]
MIPGVPFPLTNHCPDLWSHDPSLLGLTISLRNLSCFSVTSLALDVAVPVA